MKISKSILLLATFLFPMSLLAGEPSKGTVIMLSSASAWVVITSGLIFFKQWRQIRSEKCAPHRDR